MSRLFVPVQLDVLLVRQDGGHFADCAMAEPTVDNRTHRELWKPPLSELDGGRPRGAYLHWALPDGLTRGTVGDDGNAAFPAIPDRWLVVRHWPSARPGRRAVRAWVLEADRGVSHPLEGWAEPGGAPVGQSPLTALGHGDPAWAAYFDNVVDRLAFFDDLADVVAGPIGYVVSGWYSSSALDPLADPMLGTRVDAHARLDELRWRITGRGVSESGDRVASAALFHGAAVGLAWPAAGAGSPEVGGPPSPAGIRVVLAGTTCEALATLLARSDDEARVLEAAELGVLGELAEPDGRSRLDAILHASGFGSLPGGEVTERVTQPETAPELPPRPPVSPVSPVSRPLARVPGVATRTFAAADRAREAVVSRGRLRDLVASLSLEEEPPPPTGPVEVHRSLPRYFHPTDPVIVIEGAHRSFKHGGDGRFTREGMLACRLAGDTVRELSIRDPRAAGARLVARGEDLLERQLGNPNIPAECQELLREAVLLDPGAAAAAATTLLPRSAGRGAPDAHLERRIAVEQTAWWALRDDRLDPAGLLVNSGVTGTLPSPVAITPPSQPWTPLHVEWQAEYLPSALGARAWSLGEIDFDPSGAEIGAALLLEGRTLVTSAPADIAGASARRTVRAAARVATASALEAGVTARFASDVAAALSERTGGLVAAGDDGSRDVATALASLDLLGGTLDPLHAGLRGGRAFDELSPAGPTPRSVIALRAGFLRLLRLRLVDGFGQFVDLLGTATPARLDVAETMRLPELPDRAALPPRLTAPARLWLRYTDATGNDATADPGTTPLAGFLLPNHLDGALEIFDARGTSRGSLREGVDGGIVFEAAPGIATTLGGRPIDALGDPTLAGIVEGLLDWGITDAAAQTTEGALTALLRVVDAVRWSVDPLGHGVDDDLGPLIGRPLAVLTARARLEVAAEDAALLDRVELPLRLGSIANLQDGLHGAFADGDFRRLLAAGAAAGMAREVGPGRGYLQQAPLVAGFHQRFAADLDGAGDGATPVTHPYVARDALITLRPGRDVPLALLVEPYGLVHATTGVLPRKEVGMRREWLAPALARLAPTFRFGPVLVDPKRVRLPLAREAGGAWSWAHRVDETTWEEAQIVDAASQSAPVGGTPLASEGWLRFTPAEEPPR